MAAGHLAQNRKISHVFGDFAVKIGKEVDKTKRLATEKVIHPESTPETKEMIEALTLFKEIESRINLLSDGTIDSLYNAQESITIHSSKLSEILLSNNIKNNNETIDLFANFTQKVMGRKLFILTETTNEYLLKMRTQLIEPINIYKNKELTETKQLLKEYEHKKFEYDLAVHKNKKKGNNYKMNQEFENKQKELNMTRFKVIENIKDLKIRQETNLLNCFKKYWKSYALFAECQSEMINLKDFMETEYNKQKLNIDLNTFETTKLNKYKCGIPNILIKLKHILFQYKGHVIKCIFRLGCDKSELKYVQKLINENKIKLIDFKKIESHTVAALIKIFYRDLPRPIFSHISLDKLIDTKTIKDAQIVIEESIPEPYFSYYMFLLDLVIEVSKYNDVNSMSVNNLCIVIAPNLYDLTEVNKANAKRLVVITTALITLMSLCVKSRIQLYSKIDLK